MLRRGRSCVLDSADGLAFDLGPVDRRVQLLVYQANRADVVASYNVQTKRHLGGRLSIVRRVDDPLYRRFEDLGRGG